MAFTKLEPTGVNTSATFTFSNANITGNLTVTEKTNLGAVGNITITGGTSGYVLGTDGSGTLSWVAQTGGGGGGDYSNANVAAYLPTYTGNISADYFIGNGSTLTHITGGNVDGQVANALIAGTVFTNAQPNITSLGTLSNLNVTANVGAGNVLTNNLLYANGVAWSFGSTYSNTNVAAYLPTYAGNITAGNVTATADVSGAYLRSTNSQGDEGGEILLYKPQTNSSIAGTGVTIDLYQNKLRIFEQGGTARGGFFDITALGAGVSTDLLAGGGSGYANSNVAAYLPTYTGNFTAGNISVTSNVTSAYFIGNGSQLTSLNASNISTGTIPTGVLGNSSLYVGTTSIALNRSSGSQTLNGVSIDGSANYATYAGTVTTNAQPNITSTGTLNGLTATNTVNLTGASNVSLGPVANIHITGGTTGQYLQTDGSGTLSWATVSAGSGSSISNGTSNVNIASSGGNVTTSVGGNANVVVVTGTGANVDGYLTVTGALSTGGGSGGSLLGANVISANFFVGNGSSLSSITGANVTGTVANATHATSAGTATTATTATSATTAETVTTAAQPNITSVGTLVNANIAGNLFIGGNLIVNGTTEYNNVTNLYVKDPIIEMGGNANAGALTSNDNKDRGTLLHYYTTTPVDAFMGWDTSASEFAFGSNVSMTGEVATFNSYGNVRASYYIGNGSQLTGVISTANYAAYAGSVVNATQSNITSVGSLASLTVTGLVTATAGGIKVGNLQDTSGTNTLQLLNGDIIVTGDISAGGGGTGNVTATYFIGNGSQLTGLPAPYANSNVENYLPTYTGNFTADNINASSNITATYFIGNGSQLTGISGGSSYANSNVADYLPTYTGNIAAGNGTISGTFTVNGSLSAGGGTGGSISGANVITANYFTGTLTTSAQPNVTSLGTLSSLSISGLTTLAETTEVVAVPTGTTYDVTLGSVFYVDQPGADFTPNFTNLPTTDNRISIVTLIIKQSATPGMPTAIQIGGVSQTIKWPNGTTPTGTASSIQTIAFAFLRYGAAWTVTGANGAYL